MTKHILESRTFWVAVLTGVAGVLAAIAGEYPAGWVVTAQSVAMIALRLVTISPVKL